MCGVIGYRADKASEKALWRIKRLIEESQIRGKHATGCCFEGKEGLCIYKDSVPAGKFLEIYWDRIREFLLEKGSVSFIAHTRYTTSGPEHPQPIVFDGLAVCFNGVIEQSDSSTWEEKYGFKPRTTNDAEILHWAAEKGIPWCSAFPSASMAALILSNGIHSLRNGKRPLWTMYFPDGDEAWASTRDIFLRALGKEADPNMVVCEGRELQRARPF